MRAIIIEVDGTLGKYRYDYYDFYQYENIDRAMEEREYLGGGQSWKGIVFGVLVLRNQKILQEIHFDPEGDCLAIWSNSKNHLIEIAALVEEMEGDSKLLAHSIFVAEKHNLME